MNVTSIVKMPVVFKILEAAADEIFNETGHRFTCFVRELEKPELWHLKATLANLVSLHFDLSWEEIISNSKAGLRPDARHCYMYLAHTVLRLSHKEVATDCRRSDHTSSVNAVNKIERMYYVKDDLAKTVDKIKYALNHEITVNTIAATGNRNGIGAGISHTAY